MQKAIDRKYIPKLINHKSVVILCILGCLIPSLLTGQLFQTHFQKLETNRDESLSESFCLEEDPYGFLWIGTIDGLYRYNGHSLKSFRHVPGSDISLPSNHVRQILALRNGNLLLSITGGFLAAYVRDQDIFVSIQFDSLRTRQIYDFEEDHAGNVWIATSTGLFQFNSADFLHDTLKAGKWVVDTPVTKLYAAANGALWYASEEGIRYFQNDSAHIPVFSADFSDLRVDDMFETEDHQMCILTSGNSRIWLYHAATDTFKPVPGLPFETQTALYGVGAMDGSVWISELGIGLYHVNPKTGTYQFYNPEHPNVVNLSDKYLRKPIRDYAGNVWLPGLAVYKIPATYKTIRNFSENLNNTRTISAMHFENDITWLGTLGGGLIKYNRKNNTKVRFDKAPLGELPDERVYCIKPWDASHLIVTTRNFLNILHKETGKVKTFPVSNGPIRWATVLGDSIWVTHSGPGIFCINPKTGKKSRFLMGDNGQPVISQATQIVQDSAQNLWLATITDGLVKFNPHDYSVTRYISSDPGSAISSNTVRVIVIGKEVWWIGTTVGLNKFDPETGQFTMITMADGLSGDLVQNIVEDNHGHIWMTAGSGISHYDPSTGTIRNFFLGDGLINNQFYSRAYGIDQDGFICFGGSEGLDAFDPAQMDINPVAPKIWIDQISVSDQNLLSGLAPENVDEIFLHHQKAYCEIDFAATHFTDPSGNQYAYMIDEIHDDWIFLGKNHKVTLVGLKPGEYQLKVKASNSDDVWSQERLLKIRIPPPFWQTWWFRAIALLCITGGIIWLVRLRLRMIRREEQVRSEFREKLAESEMRALRAQMNPHFIFNSLNSIKSFIATNEPRLASDYLSKFAMLMRKILSHSKEEFITLQEELDALSLYIELEQLRFNHKFIGELEIDPALEPSSIEIPPLILQPFIENAIWHGLMHKEDPGHLYVRVEEKESMLYIEIEDDGVGRSQAIEQKSKTAEKNKSYGMQITTERIQMRSNGHSAIEVTDLVDANGSPMGTLVKIKFPCKKKS